MNAIPFNAGFVELNIAEMAESLIDPFRVPGPDTVVAWLHVDSGVTAIRRSDILDMATRVDGDVIHVEWRLDSGTLQFTWTP